MAPNQSRRSSLLPSLGLGAGALLLACQLTGRTEEAFLTATPAVRGRTAMRGFKDDFDAWRSSLTPEERSTLQAQAAGEFNKKFRKSDDFKAKLPEEKIQAFSKILGKFFDSEVEDYKKEVEAKTPDYDGLLKKAGSKVMDMSLKNRVVEIDRDADRRYQFATMREREAVAKGELFPQSSPLKLNFGIANDDAEAHEKAAKIIEFFKEASGSAPAAAKPIIDAFVAKGVPAAGSDFSLTLPVVLVNQLHSANDMIREGLAEMAQEKTEAEVEAFKKDQLPAIGAEVIKYLADKHAEARSLVDKDVSNIKDFFGSQADMPGKTKADVLQDIWAELPKALGKDVPPLDDELLAELKEEPAIVEGEFRHSWGIAEKLYKSEAIDPFGQKYLLGVFETKDEATKAFDDWNKEYVEARKGMEAEMAQWSKQEQARLDADPTDNERVKKVLDEARR